VSTLKEIVDSNKRLADATLGQSHAINRLALSFERIYPAFEQLRHDVYDIKADREIDNDAVKLTLERVNTTLALVLDNLKTTQVDVKELARDVTGSHVLHPPEHKKPKIVEVIEAVERVSVVTKVLLFVALIILAASGWLTHILAG
jgi:hypothetical protein